MHARAATSNNRVLSAVSSLASKCTDTQCGMLSRRIHKHTHSTHAHTHRSKILTMLLLGVVMTSD